MKSKFDYADPSTDPTYCDGLQAAPDEPIAICLICGRQRLRDEFTPYCSAICAVEAAADNERDDVSND